MVHPSVALHPCLPSIWKIRRGSSWRGKDKGIELLPPNVADESWSALLSLRTKWKSWKMITVNWVLLSSSWGSKCVDLKSKWWNTYNVAVRLCLQINSKSAILFVNKASLTIDYKRTSIKTILKSSCYNLSIHTSFCFTISVGDMSIVCFLCVFLQIIWITINGDASLLSLTYTSKEQRLSLPHLSWPPNLCGSNKSFALNVAPSSLESTHSFFFNSPSSPIRSIFMVIQI